VNLKVRPRDTHAQDQKDAKDNRERAVTREQPPRDEEERKEKGCADHRVTAREGVAGGDTQPLEQIRAQAPYQHLRREVEAERARHTQRQKHRRSPPGPPQPEDNDQAEGSQHIDGAGDVEEEGGPGQEGGAVCVQPGEDGGVERDGLLVMNLVG